MAKYNIIVVVLSSSEAAGEYPHSKLKSYLQRTLQVQSEKSGHLEGREHGEEKRRSRSSTRIKENRGWDEANRAIVTKRSAARHA
jgi:hypothetical protein